MKARNKSVFPGDGAITQAQWQSGTKSLGDLKDMLPCAKSSCFKEHNIDNAYLEMVTR